MRYMLLHILLIASLFVQAQQSDVSLAYKYYQNHEYEKAAELFEKLYNEQHNGSYLSSTVNCLLKIKEYEKSEQLLKKHIKRYKKDIRSYVELGSIYKSKGNLEKAKKQFDYALEAVGATKYEIISIANVFLSKGEFDYANQVYEKGAKIMDYHFYQEKADAFSYQRKYKDMINSYLDYLKEEPTKMLHIQNRLQSKLNDRFEENMDDIFKKALIARIQKEPDFYLYNEMLIWLYVQQKNFSSAIIQAKALDRRRKEEGVRLLELGKLALQNNDYSTANEAFEYVMDKGKGAQFYSEAKEYYLYVQYELITLGEINEVVDIQKVEQRYVDFIAETALSVQTIKLTKYLAHLQAFFLNKPDEAIKQLKTVIDNKRIGAELQGFCKIELGDILTLQDDVAGAIMEYAQAANMNKTNGIGDKAKLKRATLAFYMGNFQWAQAQLDVLKAATTKLIANDAFKLSCLIKDNIDSDTTTKALEYYAHAELLLQQNKQVDALRTLDTLEQDFSNNSLIDDVLFLKASIYEKSGDIPKAIECLTKISTDYSTDLLGDDANYKLAQIYDYKVNNQEKAKEYYKKIIFDYPSSIYADDARKRFRFFRGNKNID